MSRSKRLLLCHYTLTKPLSYPTHPFVCLYNYGRSYRYILSLLSTIVFILDTSELTAHLQIQQTIQKGVNMEGLNLTFGVELEFVVAYRAAQYTNLPPHRDPDSAVRAHIIYLLQEAGFSTNGLTPPLNYELWTVGTDGSIEAEPDDPLLPQWNEFGFSAVELITPTFFWSQSAIAFQHLERALQIIQQEFTAFTNGSCGK